MKGLHLLKQDTKVFIKETKGTLSTLYLVPWYVTLLNNKEKWKERDKISKFTLNNIMLRPLMFQCKI